MPRDPKPKLAPKLRFPEFRDIPVWEETILGSVLTEHGEKDDGASEVHSVSVHKGVINQVEHLGRSYAAADRSNYNLAKPYDVIYTKSPTGDFPWGVVKQNRLPFNVIVSPLYGVFSPVNRHLGYILDAYFESPIRTSNYLAPITQKGAKNTIQISNDTFLSKGLYLPKNEAEHRKIAECLSSLNELIGAEIQKHDALKAHKKGLMQQLFPSEGDTLPSLRFPNFKEAWAETQLERLCDGIYSGRDHNESDGAFDLYGSTGIIGKTKVPSHSGHHILVARVGANAGLLNKVSGQFGVTDNTLVVSLLPSTNIDYIFYYLGNININRLIFGSGQPLITGSILKNLRVLLPVDSEQRKISSCFASLDDLIAAQSDKLDALKIHKQGLIQQLFPSPSGADA
jgi:type I restriction enzyme S subunit